jgi:uncharacterized protein (TIGR03437 family)
VKISKLVVAAAMIVSAPTFADGQSAPVLFFTPSVLFAGTGAPELRVYAAGVTGALTVCWNGVDRPTTVDSSGLHVQLTAQDVAAPTIAEISLTDPKTGLTVVSGFIAVGYNVIPSDVVFDRARNRFYVTTLDAPGDTRFPGHSLVALNPDTGVIGPVLAIGSSPGNMAMSDDGSALYVAVDGDGVVRRVNPDSFAVVSEFRFRTAFTGTMGGGFGRSAIAVMPGNPQTVALYRHPDAGTSLTGISIFDNGLKRTNEIDSPDGFDGLLFSPDGKTLFLGSYRNFNSPQAVLCYSVDATGIPKQTPVSVTGGGPVTVLDGVLYTSRGTLIDVKTLTVISSLGIGGSVAIDPVNKRILATHFQALSNISDYPEYVQAFDFATQEPLGWQAVDTVFYASAGTSSVQRLIRFGTDGLLFTSTRGLLLFHTPLAGPAPATESRAVVNAAGQQGGAVAPGEIVSIYGTNLGPGAPATAGLNAAGAIDPALSHVQVWFDRFPGTVLMAYKGQLNVIAPFELQPGSTVNLQVWNYGIPSARIPIPVAAAVPALFTRDGSGSGPVSLINQDGTINTPSPPGTVITVFGTGGGPSPGAVDGGVARSAKSLAGSVHVFIGGREATVFYAGAAPQLPNGVFQINVQVPADTPSGMAPVGVTVSGQESPKGASLEIR